MQNVTNKLNGTDYTVLPDYSIGSASSYNNTGGYDLSAPTQNTNLSEINYVASDNPDFSYLVN
ncbi:MAG: hypothetical protein IJ677_05790 [Alphaproteobacteria bacterium]|nr:hypothetical protein [Alphaproteobacteria bacterium]